MKKIMIVFLLFSSFMIFSQKQDDNLDIGVDLMSRYIFRGTDVGGASPSIQPYLTYTYNKLTIGLWGAYSTNITATQETDFYVSYEFNDHFNVLLTDYFFPSDNSDYKYFNYDKSTTGHLLEATLNYSGTKKIPVSLLLATNFYGSDAVRLNPDGTRKDIQYSTYAEIGYAFKKFDTFIGFNLTDPDESLGETGFYGDGLGVVNLGLKVHKKIKITDKYDLPINFSLITNPQAEKIFFVFGISL